MEKVLFKQIIGEITKVEEFTNKINSALNAECDDIFMPFYTMIDLYFDEKLSEDKNEHFYNYVYENFNGFSDMNDDDVDEFYNFLFNE